MTYGGDLGSFMGGPIRLNHVYTVHGSVTTIEEFHWRAWIFIPLAGILAGIFQIFCPSADHLTGLIVSRFGFFNNYLVHCPGLSNYITMNNCVVAFVFYIFHPF